jgi:hypothetical protein
LIISCIDRTEGVSVPSQLLIVTIAVLSKIEAPQLVYVHLATALRYVASLQRQMFASYAVLVAVMQPVLPKRLEMHTWAQEL